jgi:hypothetical protein
VTFSIYTAPPASGGPAAFLELNGTALLELNGVAVRGRARMSAMGVYFESDYVSDGRRRHIVAAPLNATGSVAYGELRTTTNVYKLKRQVRSHIPVAQWTTVRTRTQRAFVSMERVPV